MARVLLADDDPAVRMPLEQMLKEGGHAVVTARVGHALLDDLKAARYDLVITDVNMPALDGWDVASWVRERRPGTPVIAIGGDVDGSAPRPTYSTRRSTSRSDVTTCCASSPRSWLAFIDFDLSNAGWLASGEEAKACRPPTAT